MKKVAKLTNEERHELFLATALKMNMRPAVMSIETYEQLAAKFELYSSIERGMQDIRDSNTRSFSEAMAELRSKRRR